MRNANFWLGAVASVAMVFAVGCGADATSEGGSDPPATSVSETTPGNGSAGGAASEPGTPGHDGPTTVNADGSSSPASSSPPESPATPPGGAGESSNIGNTSNPSPTPLACPRSEGYWKTHATAWPVSSLALGGTSYSEATLLAILGSEARGDASVILAGQLVSALLNDAGGAPGSTAIAGVVEQAQHWFVTNAGHHALPLGIDASTPAGAAALALAAELEVYNDGGKCE